MSLGRMVLGAAVIGLGWYGLAHQPSDYAACAEATARAHAASTADPTLPLPGPQPECERLGADSLWRFIRGAIDAVTTDP